METGTTLTVPAGAEGLRQVAAAFDLFSSRNGVPPALAWRVRVALDEVLSNIARHGGHPDNRIDVSFRRVGGFLEFTVSDAGPPFDPLAHAPPDLTNPLEARQPGGLGIAIVKALFDDVAYRRTDRNVLVLRKRINPGAPPELT